MSNKPSQKIEKGDIVDLVICQNEEMGRCFLNVEVLYTPQATGDSWHIRTKEGKIIYVQTFAYMELVEKKGEPK
jgi:hypothetical protein